MNKSIIEQICLNSAILRKRTYNAEHEKLSDEAYKLFEQLNGVLNDQQKKIFNEYVDAEIIASAEAEVVHFREGLKTGLLLAIECLT